jgi:hypothetical protein
MSPGEAITLWVSGQSHQLMALTDRRVVVVKPGRMAGHPFGVDVTSFPLNSISSVEVLRRLNISFIVIRAAGSPAAHPKIGGRFDGYKMPNVIPISSADLAQHFANEVMQAVARLSSPAGLYANSAGHFPSVADEISKLARLLQDGLLSKEEFEYRKAKLLSS